MALLVFGAARAFCSADEGLPVYPTASLVANQPMGGAKGIFPGRVVWVHDPGAVNQNCVVNDPGNAWYFAENDNQAVIDGMVSTALRDLTGENSDGAAWAAIFRFHNTAAGKGAVNYVPGEKIFIKTNATSAWNGNFNTGDLTPNSDPASPYSFVSETSVGPVLAVLRQLVHVVGVAQRDIYVGDPLKHIYKHLYDVWHGEFPNVHYIDNSGFTNLGREVVVPSTTAVIHYSDRGAVLTDPYNNNVPVRTDYFYAVLRDADYLINIPMLKGHKRAGVTMFAKNHFGSQTQVDASHLHNGLVAPAEMGNGFMRSGYGLYRVQVDLMGHSLTGRKNLLFLMDALWATDFELDVPLKWQMPPFNNSYSASIFASLDPVAVESVGYDFLRSEFTAGRVPAAGTYVQMTGVDDYLHQAADSASWPVGIVYDPDNTGSPIGSLGTHEHWNNATTMQYSRNLSPAGSGIELRGIPVITWAAPAPITYGAPLSSAQLNATANVPGTFVYSPAAGTVLTANTRTLSMTFTPTAPTIYTTATATQSLVVNKAVPVITWAAPAPINYGTPLSAAQLNATANVPGTFVYSPAAGTVLTANTRTLSVNFTPADTTDYATVTATQSLVVNKAVPVITWAAPAAITYGTPLSPAQLNATANVPGAFVYSPAAGTVLTASIRTLKASFTPTDTLNYTGATATRSLVVNKAVPVITWATPAAITYGTPLSSAQLNATANVPGTFVYSPAAGTVLTANIRTLSVKFTPADTTDYTNAAATQKLVVNKVVPVITWATPAAITYGTPLSATQLDATANVPGTFVYSPAAGTVLTANIRTLSAKFTPADTTDYTNAAATQKLVVNKVVPVITWATPAAITYGTPLSATQLDATANVPGTFVYSPAAGTVLTANIRTLSAKFTPADTTDYTNATATQKLVVNKAVPVITWATPAAITYGTPLSATQLNAAANVPGTFVYSPAAGTVLSTGAHTLTATFTPNDTTDYTTKTATQALTVTVVE